MTITKEGALASFYTMNKAPIKHLKVYFSPKQAGSGDASPENVREINGQQSLTLSRAQKNLGTIQQLLGDRPYTEVTEDGRQCVYVKASGAGNIGLNPISFENAFKQNMQYTLSFYAKPVKNPDSTGDPTSPFRIYIDYTDDTSDLLDIWPRNNNNENVLDTWATFSKTSKPNKTIKQLRLGSFEYRLMVYIDINTFQIEEGTQATTYEPYKGTTQIIDWSSTLGTIYGGYIDLITGELVQEWNYLQIIPTNADDTGIVSNKRLYYWSIDTNKLIDVNSLLIPKCNIISNYNKQLTINSQTDTFTIISNGQKLLIYILLNNTNKLSDDLNIQICYPLITSIHYQLTPLELQTFLGRNNIWSNADKVEIEYNLAETNEELYKRRNIILNSAPHIATSTGLLTNFKTDLAIPLKECKVNFLPIQAGSGDPSSENIRAINGKSSILIKQSGRNLFDINLLSGNNITIANNIVSATGGWFHSNFGESTGIGVPLDINFGNSRWVLSMDAYTTGDQAIEHTMGLYIYFDYTDGTRSAYGCYNDDTSFTNYIFTSSVGKQLNRIRFSYSQKGNNVWYIKNIHLEQLDTFNNYEPYVSQTIPIDWTNDYGEIYGGYINLTTGELVQEWKKINITDYTWYNYSSKIHYYITLSAGGREANTDIYSNLLTPRPNGRFLDENVGDFTYYNSTNNTQANTNYKNYIWTKLPETMENADANDWIQSAYPNAYIVYKLETPIHYQLTPQQLTAFKGVNNIWSDANGPISVQYWTH